MAMKHLDEDAIFNAARRIESAAERDAFIRQACGDNAGLAQRVHGLLAALAGDHDFLVQPVLPVRTEDYRPIAEGPGTVIGPYKLLQQIGEGGFGVVFMAEQQEPIRRTVAL